MEELGLPGAPGAVTISPRDFNAGTSLLLYYTHLTSSYNGSISVENWFSKRPTQGDAGAAADFYSFMFLAA